MNRKSSLFLVWVVTLVSAGTLGFHFGQSPAQPLQVSSTSLEAPPAPPARLELARVASRQLQSEVVAVGNLTTVPDRESRVGAPLAGRVAEVYRSVGDRVLAGEPLAMVTSPEFTKLVAEHHHALLRRDQARASRDQSAQSIRLGDETRRPLEESRGEFVNSRTELEVRRSARQLSEKNLKRIDSLFRLGVVSARELEVARADLSEARAREAQAVALLGLATQHRAREQTISSQQAFIGPRLTQLETELELAEEEVRHLEVIVQNLGVEGEEETRGLILKSPRSGTIVERNASLGQALAADEEVFRIVDSSQLWLWVHVPELELGRIGLHSRATLRPSQESLGTFDGEISYLAPILDPETRTARARFVVDNRAGKLKAGMFMRATFATQRSQTVLTVPPEAVVVEGTQALVFRPQAEGFEKIPVEVGVRADEWLEVRGDLKEGQEIVRQGQAALEVLRR